MGMSWTKEQQQVIDLRNRNILVSAAAGSGKTAVLVERIKERVLDKEHPIDIDELLVVTFTNAAAAQMKERVAKALEKELLEHPADVRLQQQSALVLGAQITTIDSFCLYVIRNHFHEIDLEPNFRIADEGELKLLREDVIARLMETCYEEQEPGFLQLIDSYAGSRSDEAVKELILKLYQYAQSYPWPIQWLDGVVADYEITTIEELEKSPLMQCVMTDCKHMLAGVLEKAEQYLTICQEADGPYMYEKACEADVIMLEAMTEADSYMKVAQALAQRQFQTLGRTKEYTGSVEKKEYVQAQRKEVKDILEGLCKMYFSLTEEEIIAQQKRLKPVVKTLVTTTKRFLEAFAQRKRSKNLVDFNDMEHFALEILVDEETGEAKETAREFQRAFEEIMIDEYQDSNYVQESILRAISREQEGIYNIFMVGDVKQSIYRFRLARPELFMDKYDHYSKDESSQQRIDLHKNFRSRDEVLSFTNDIFYQIMKRDLGGVEYDEAAALYTGAAYQEAEQPLFNSELLIAEEDAELMKEAGMSRIELEAKMVADKITELMKKQLVTDEHSGELRPLRYGDIVILLRSLTDWADTFARVLNVNGIPAHTISKTGYFSTIEIQTVLNYLRILDNPMQDIPLTAVLKSPIAALSDEELAKIRMLDRQVPFYQCVRLALETEAEQDEKTKKKLRMFADTYQALRKRTCDMPIHELLLLVLEQTGYADYAAAMPAGRQRQANIDMLIEKAIDYEQTSYRGLFHFIRYIDELQKFDVDFGEADLVGENDNAVNIMSIHKSKGLEFPVCFVSGMGKGFNKQDSRSKMILHPSLGAGMDEIDVKRRLKIPSFTKKVIARQTDLENLGEELRVLYVALTRAKEKLIITGTMKDARQQIATLREVCSGRGHMSFLDRSNAKTFLDWMVTALCGQEHPYQIEIQKISDMVEQEAMHQLNWQEVLEERIRAAYTSDSVEYQALDERLSKQYPYQEAVELVTKYSVSELKHRAMREKAAAEELDTTPVFLQEVVTPYIPPFMEGKVEENQGALRGTAVHRVLECYDFRVLPEDKEEVEADIEGQLTRLLHEGKVTEEMCQLIAIPTIAGFLDSPLARRMKQAALSDNLFREKPFVMNEQEEVDSDMILIQGIIDVFWVEADGIVLLDYKTDRVDSAAQLKNMYTEQLNLYQQALERIFGVAVKEKYLYSFRLQQAILV